MFLGRTVYGRPHHGPWRQSEVLQEPQVQLKSGLSEDIRIGWFQIRKCRSPLSAILVVCLKRVSINPTRRRTIRATKSGRRRLYTALDLAMMMSIAKVESDFDPRVRTGPRPPFGLPDALVTVLTSRLSCRKAGNTRIFTPDRESFGGPG